MSAPAEQPPLSVPTEARLRVKPASPGFTDAVLADLITIRRTATGRALFQRLRSVCAIVTIEKPNPPVDPPNAWTRLRDSKTASTIEIVIVYDPVDWPSGAHRDALPSDVLLFGRLLDAVALAEGAKPQSAWDDVVAPAIAAYLRDRLALGSRPAPAQS